MKKLNASDLVVEAIIQCVINSYHIEFKTHNGTCAFCRYDMIDHINKYIKPNYLKHSDILIKANTQVFF